MDKHDELTRLIAKWRAENGDYPDSKRDCADELESALAQQGKAGGVELVDTTIAAHVASQMHGPKYGVDWVYHCDVRGLLSEREAFAPPANSPEAGVTDEMVERLARHLCREEWKDRCQNLEQLTDLLKHARRYHDEARAMLTVAMTAPQPKDAT